jgi:drug/metabolite transporter (DMT)-like permease
MSVALRMALQRDPDVALGTTTTVVTALGVGIVAAAAEAPARGLHLGSAWPFLLAGLLSPGAAQILVTVAIRESGASRVSPLVAIESLVGVALSALLLRDSELVGKRLLLGAALIVAGGALIGAFR